MQLCVPFISTHSRGQSVDPCEEAAGPGTDSSGTGCRGGGATVSVAGAQQGAPEHLAPGDQRLGPSTPYLMMVPTPPHTHTHTRPFICHCPLATYLPQLVSLALVTSKLRAPSWKGQRLGDGRFSHPKGGTAQGYQGVAHVGGITNIHSWTSRLIQASLTQA